MGHYIKMSILTPTFGPEITISQYVVFKILCNVKINETVQCLRFKLNIVGRYTKILTSMFLDFGGKEVTLLLVQEASPN